MNKTLDDFLNRKKPQTAETAPSSHTRQDDETDEINYRAFGINRGTRQVLMLDVRTLKRGRLGFSYSYLESVFFDESGFLVLSIGSYKITVEGRNLSPLYEGLLNHSVRFVQQENPELENDISGNDTFITEIEVTESE